MSHAAPADQGVEVKVWLHPRDAATIEAAAGRGEGTKCSIVRECVAMCLHFGLRPWRALAARHRAESALRSLYVLEDLLRGAPDPRDALDMVDAIRADIRAASLPDGETPHHRLKAPPDLGPGRG